MIIEPPTFFSKKIEQAQSVTRSVTRFARSGFVPTPPETLESRLAICRACLEWDSTGFRGTGRCRKCGCSTWAKLRMASEACPLGKWGAVPPKTEN